MEKMPYRDAPGSGGRAGRLTAHARTTTTSDWRQALPVLTGSMVTLRELRLSDAPSLLAMLSTEEVARFISPPPTTVDGFERFIAWTHRERAAGNYALLRRGAARDGHGDRDLPGPAARAGIRDRRMGIRHRLRVLGHGRVHRRREDGRSTSRSTSIGAHRLEARAAVANGRGNGALRKVGAVQEGVLRKSFLRNGEYLDQTLWTILDEDWRRAKSVWGGQIH